MKWFGGCCIADGGDGRQIAGGFDDGYYGWAKQVRGVCPGSLAQWIEEYRAE
jgi:hypothetical protein